MLPAAGCTSTERIGPSAPRAALVAACCDSCCNDTKSVYNLPSYGVAEAAPMRLPASISRLIHDLRNRFFFMMSYMDASRLQGRCGVLGQIGCSFISGLWCRSKPAGPDGIR